MRELRHLEGSGRQLRAAVANKWLAGYMWPIDEF